MKNIRVIIKNFKCIKECSIELNKLSFLIGSNGAGKSTIIEAIEYFYANLTHNKISQNVFDQNNLFSNCLKIVLIYDCNDFIDFAKSNSINFMSNNKYLSNIISLKKINNGILKIEMSQIKGKKIEWSVNYEIRSLIESLFPLFTLNAHEIDYFDWDTIWNMLADLNKISNIEKERIHNEIKKVINEKNKVSDKISKTMRILKTGDISINNFTTKSFTKKLLNIYFSGNQFTKNEKNISYYSDGTITISYLTVFLEIINEISDTKMKSPIVMFDEPEISLHPSYIKSLAHIFCDYALNTNILISTHSPRLVKTASIKMQNKNINLYNIKINNNYTKIKKMKSISDAKPSEKFRILDEHINSYFSKGILFVEGESELELFSNDYLQILFPFLSQIDVFKAMTDNKMLKQIDPNIINSWAPCLYLIDLDKALKYDKDNNSFKIKCADYIEKNKERVKYFNKKKDKFDLRLMRIRLEKMANNLKIHYKLPFYSCNDRNYIALKNVISKYMLEYNYFVLNTTIEGMLINSHTKELYLDFLKKKHKATYDTMINWYNSITDNEKVNLLRMVTEGYSDLFVKLKTVEKECKSGKIKRVNKTEGWITDFIFFCIKEKINCEDIMQFKKYINDSKNLEKVRNDFLKLFPELNYLINKLYDMIE